MRSEKAQGWSIITDPAFSRPVENDITKCAHCHFDIFVRPFETPPGWCDTCDKYICDKPSCHHECSPYMKKVEADERRARARYDMLRDMGLA